MSPKDLAKVYALCFPSHQEAARAAAHMKPEVIHGWLLWMAAQNLTLTHQLLEEIRNMAQNDGDLTQAVQDLLFGYTTLTNAITDELAAIRLKGSDVVDPVVAAAVTNIEKVVADMKLATAAAQAAVSDGTGTASAPAAGDATSADASTDQASTPAAGGAPAGSSSPESSTTAS